MLPFRNAVDSFIFNMQDRIGRNFPKISSRSFPYFPRFTFYSEFAAMRLVRVDRLKFPVETSHLQIAAELIPINSRLFVDSLVPRSSTLGRYCRAAETSCTIGKICLRLTIQKTEFDYHSRIEEFSLFTKQERCQNQALEKSSPN